MTTLKEREQQRAKRNLHPHAAAVAAMYLYSAEYAAQRGGSMDFWDGLDDHRKRLCCEMVFKIGRAPSIADGVREDGK